MTLAYPSRLHRVRVHYNIEYSHISYNAKAWLIPELRLKPPAVRLFILRSLVVQPNANSPAGPGHEDYARSTLASGVAGLLCYATV